MGRTMLSSTGFFQAIGCPCWSGVPGNPCQQPYCHFRVMVERHLPQQSSLGMPGPTAAGHRPLKDAIQAVRSEVELEQRRYRDLLEMAREHRAAEAPALAPCNPDGGPVMGLDDDAFPLAFHYRPSSHSLLSPNASYQATLAKPASKYLLAFPNRGQGRGRGGSGALEYVPKAVSQPQGHKRPIPSGKYWWTPPGHP
ncbi:hypothetical protein P7K49_022562 [Saguinus oedipus]|uniref:Uncharacterized protein n=1 Tax=Saguinus oedipus TaxID=9490 RepID=A0ABQ9UWP7_SAGOE|nr:hypothetical protein P7K49_022562 [Saguinus oedipus]